MYLRSKPLTRIFHELPSRDHETGNPLAGLSGAQRARIRWACHLATAGCWSRGVPERYVAGADIRGRQEERPYPWSQQVIHKISGLALIIHGSVAPSALPPSPLIWHIYCNITWRTKIHGAEYGRKDRIRFLNSDAGFLRTWLSWSS